MTIPAHRPAALFDIGMGTDICSRGALPHDFRMAVTNFTNKEHALQFPFHI